MTDYHQRFRERFHWKNIRDKDYDEHQKEVLAFIDEVGTEKYAEGFKQGVFDTTVDLIEKVEGMKLLDCSPELCGGTCKYPRSQGYNQALDDLLKTLSSWTVAAPNSSESAESGLPQEETECCAFCSPATVYEGNATECTDRNCPCHKPRTEAPKVGEPIHSPCVGGNCTSLHDVVVKKMAPSRCSFHKEMFAEDPITSEEKEEGVSSSFSGRTEGAKIALEWIETYARRICTNDATGNMRAQEADMVVSPSLILQAFKQATKENAPKEKETPNSSVREKNDK